MDKTEGHLVHPAMSKIEITTIGKTHPTLILTSFQYKNGSVTETVFEKFEVFEKIISNRVKCGLIEEKISKSRIRSLLSQALNVVGDVVGDEAVGVRNILSEGIKLLDELGILLFQPYCLRWAFNLYLAF